MAWLASPHALGLPQRPSIRTGSRPHTWHRGVSVSSWRQPCTGSRWQSGLGGDPVSPDQALPVGVPPAPRLHGGFSVLLHLWPALMGAPARSHKSQAASLSFPRSPGWLTSKIHITGFV